MFGGFNDHQIQVYHYYIDEGSKWTMGKLKAGWNFGWW